MRQGAGQFGIDSRYGGRDPLSPQGERWILFCCDLIHVEVSGAQWIQAPDTELVASVRWLCQHSNLVQGLNGSHCLFRISTGLDDQAHLQGAVVAPNELGPVLELGAEFGFIIIEY